MTEGRQALSPAELRDLAGKTSIADYMIVASGRSSRQVSAMASHLVDKATEAGLAKPKVEGMAQGDWVLIDLGDVIVHLFRPEVRDFYRVEEMWGVARPAGAGETADEARQAIGT